MALKVFNKDKGIMLASSAQIASSFFHRLKGLMLKKGMGGNEALIFYRATSIHTFFMRFSIDIVFLNRQMKVKRLVNSLSPWRAVACRGAYLTIELPAGKIAASNIDLGDELEIRDS